MTDEQLLQQVQNAIEELDDVEINEEIIDGIAIVLHLVVSTKEQALAVVEALQQPKTESL